MKNFTKLENVQVLKMLKEIGDFSDKIKYIKCGLEHTFLITEDNKNMLSTGYNAYG